MLARKHLDRHDVLAGVLEVRATARVSAVLGDDSVIYVFICLGTDKIREFPGLFYVVFCDALGPLTAGVYAIEGDTGKRVGFGDILPAYPFKGQTGELFYQSVGFLKIVFECRRSYRVFAGELTDAQLTVG